MSTDRYPAYCARVISAVGCFLTAGLAPPVLRRPHRWNPTIAKVVTTKAKQEKASRVCRQDSQRQNATMEIALRSVNSFNSVQHRDTLYPPHLQIFERVLPANCLNIDEPPPLALLTVVFLLKHLIIEELYDVLSPNVP